MRIVPRTYARRSTLLLLTMVLIASLIPVSSMAIPAATTTWYVDAVAGSDTNNGMSTSTAFATFGKAMDVAAPSDTVFVAAGTYDEEIWPVEVVPGIEVYGAGADETAFVGDGTSQLINLNTLVPFSVTGQTMMPANRIEGITFTGGDASTGGAAAIRFVDMTFADCVFVGNTAHDGGALHAYDAILTLENCVFDSNGNVEYPDFDDELIPLIEEPRFTEYGGAVFTEWSDLSIDGCTFIENAAGYGGAAVLAVGGEVMSHDSEFLGNMTADGMIDVRDVADPSALLEALSTGDVATVQTQVKAQRTPMFDGIFTVLDTHAHFTGNVFDDNSGMVGGIMAVSSEITVEDSLFTNTKSFLGPLVSMRTDLFASASVAPTNLDALGMGIASSATLDRCVFTDNLNIVTALAVESDLSVTNSLFAHNNLSDEGLKGEAVIIGAGGGLEVVHTTVADNNFHGGVGWFGGLIGNDEPTWTGKLVNSIVWNTDGDLEPLTVMGVENINSLTQGEETVDFLGAQDVDSPRFRNPAEGDYRLSGDSPCIDAGTSEYPMLPAIDLDGLPRPIDGDADGVADYDQGAYEFASDRVWGENRYATSAQISRRHFSEAKTVVIATGMVFADGLSASGLAGAYGAPLLLTRQGSLPDVIAEEIVRLGASRAIICGQTNAVSAAVAAQIKALGLEVTRIGGADRYETSSMIADKIVDVAGESELAFIARGDLFADALTAAPVAYAHGAPVLLVKPGELPNLTIDVIRSVGVTRAVIVGGTTAVSSAVENGISALADTERISGKNRFDTSAQFSDWAADEGFASFAYTGIATGNDFADALSGGAAVGRRGGILLLTPSATLDPSIEEVLERRAGDSEIGLVELFGGPGAVTETVKDLIMNIVYGTK